MDQPVVEDAKLLVVDDRELVGWGMRAVFSAQPWVRQCLFARRERSAVDLARRHGPDVAVIGRRVGSAGCAGLARNLRDACPDLRIVLLTERGVVSPESLRAATACGYIATAWSTQTIVEHVRQAFSGAQDLDTAHDQEALPVLSRQQHRVLGLMARGATNREIGVQLNLSHYTVQDHAKAVFRRLDARNRVQAVQRAQHLGYIA
jgi:DNA-binding NarL/FixJ family response regulator